MCTMMLFSSITIFFSIHTDFSIRAKGDFIHREHEKQNEEEFLLLQIQATSFADKEVGKQREVDEDLLLYVTSKTSVQNKHI